MIQHAGALMREGNLRYWYDREDKRIVTTEPIDNIYAYTFNKWGVNDNTVLSCIMTGMENVYEFIDDLADRLVRESYHPILTNEPIDWNSIPGMTTGYSRSLRALSKEELMEIWQQESAKNVWILP